MPVLRGEQLRNFGIPVKDPSKTRLAISHEFVELYRGDKDLRVGKILSSEYGYEIVHLGTDIASPADTNVFGSTRYPIDRLPPLPESYYMLLLKSRLIWHRKGNMGMGGFFRWTPSIIPRLLRWKPDLIFENPYLTLSPRSYMTYWAARLLNIPTVYFDCGDILPGLKLKNKIVLPLEKRVINRASAVVTYNEAGKHRFMEKYRYPEDQICVIPKPVDTVRFNPDIDTGDFKNRFDLHGKFVVAYFGRLSTNKGAKYLLETAGIMKKRGTDKDVLFLFVGGNLESEHARQFNERLKKLNLDNIRVTGMIPNESMPAAYNAADIAVFPDVTNPPGFSTVLAESMASGLPIIIGIEGRESATPIIDGHTGLIIKPGNPEGIADRIELLRGNKSLSQKLAANVLDYARREMDYSRVIERYHNLFSKITGKAINQNSMEREYAEPGKTRSIHR